ncbi:MAG: glycosyltransferase family 2 protein [Acidobacteriota bacterium]
MPSLSIVIPAYNEEASIASIIERCLAVREALRLEAQLDWVEVIVVSDGSSDRTAEIAAGYPDIKLIAYQHNRGYGAALKLGFATGKGDIVGFLDADGTCDPRTFILMCQEMIRQQADIVLGSRLHKESKMPRVRRVGNRVYAIIMSLIANTLITDTASGMRIIRRRALDKLYPLPNGLHFTPAMSCKAVLDPDLKIVEIPMPYEEREGRSKLSVVRDGLRFLNVILDISLSYRPRKLIGLLGWLLLLIAGLYSLYPVEFYLRHHRLEEWMIYRLITIMVLAVGGLNVISIGEIAERMLEAAGYRRSSRSFINYILGRLFSQHSVLIWGTAAIILGLTINLGNIIQYITTGTVTAHWSYIIFGGMTVLTGMQLIGLGLLLRFTGFLITRLQPETESSLPTPLVTPQSSQHV